MISEEQLTTEVGGTAAYAPPRIHPLTFTCVMKGLHRLKQQLYVLFETKY